jgi:hypothetical protein
MGNEALQGRKTGFLGHLIGKKGRFSEGNPDDDHDLAPVSPGDSQTVFSDEFVLDSVRIPRRDLLPYIKGKAVPELGEDFYYGYRYNAGVLSFIALKSDRYVVGNLPFFYPALMNEGKFSYKKPDAESYYYLTNSNGFCSVEVGYEKQLGYLPIEEISLPSVPKSMKLQWSLAKKNLYLDVFMAIFLCFSAIFYVVSSKSYDTAMAEQKRVASKLTPIIPRGLPSFINSVADMGKMIEGKGYIEKVTLVRDQLSYTIKFKHEEDLQVFLKNHGGRYEGTKVVYTTALSTAR